MTKAASVFSLFCGVAMLAVWGVLLATGNVVELRSTPYQAGFLLGAEFLTAFALIFGGFGLLAGKKWGLKAELAALGMLLYCTVYSIGFFSQAGNIPAAGLFAMMAALAFVFCARFILSSVKGDVQ